MFLTTFCIKMWLYAVFLSILVAVLLKIYLKLTTKWCRSQVTLIGKTVIVTGANSGIGYETALDFAKRGARVILACRNEEKGNKARDSIIEETDNNNVVLKLINMSSFDSVREFATNINKTEERLDILVNNAGVGGRNDKKTIDGQNIVMQVNYYSSFLLTHLLLGLIKKTGKGRIVNVSSMLANYANNLKVENLHVFPGQFMVYNHSKLANVLFTKELNLRLKGTDITTYSLHPGVIRTGIFRHLNGISKLLYILINSFFKTSAEGAQTTLYCSLQKGLEKYSGEHFSGCTKIAPYKSTLQPGLAIQLWEATEEIVHLKPTEKI